MRVFKHAHSGVGLRPESNLPAPSVSMPQHEGAQTRPSPLRIATDKALGGGIAGIGGTAGAGVHTLLWSHAFKMEREVFAKEQLDVTKEPASFVLLAQRRLLFG